MRKGTVGQPDGRGRGDDFSADGMLREGRGRGDDFSADGMLREGCGRADDFYAGGIRQEGRGKAFRGPGGRTGLSRGGLSPAREAGRLMLDLIFPRRCPVCHEAAVPPYKICPACRARLPYITTRRCEKCGKPVPAMDRLCDDCRQRPHYFDQGLGLFLYDDTMRGAMSYLKYQGRREYGETLGELLAESAVELAALWRPEAIVPIPLHPKKMNTRTYNQAAEIARPLSLAWGIPLAENMLVRREETRAMKNLDAGERFRNLSGAFRRGRDFRPLRCVLLVDDIYTTGATMDAAALALKEGGIHEIYFLTVCIGGGFMVQY